MMVKGNCIVGQSGGPTCVINSSLYGVIKEAKKHFEIQKIYGSLNGIQGTIQDNLIDLTHLDPENFELLKQTPSAVLGSVRYCLNKNFSDTDYEKILQTFKKYNIRFFFYIGGNDSMDTVYKLSSFCQQVQYDCAVIGIPKTIDNDLILTDHTPGYGSAIKFIANSISEIKEDTSCYCNGRVTIVEIMGRDAGWLTAGSKLACLNGNAPDLIYLPEVAFDLDDFLKKINELYQKNRKVLVCISEGIKNQHGKYVVNDFVYNNDNDVFGHMQLGGAASVLTHVVKEKLNIPVRAIELNLLQRCSSHIASGVDIHEAVHCGEYAIKQALNNQTGKMVVMSRKKGNRYGVYYHLKDIQLIANQTKFFPSEWIVNQCDISDQYIDYALPLISKEYPCKYKNGMVQFTKIK